MLRKMSLFAGYIIGIAFLAGCVPPTGNVVKSSYFNGAVVVEHQQNARGIDDYVTFRFYEEGRYEISFSISPGKRSGGHKIPQNFIETIRIAPREIIVKQYPLPYFLRVTITKNNVTESHDLF